MKARLTLAVLVMFALIGCTPPRSPTSVVAPTSTGQAQAIVTATQAPSPTGAPTNIATSLPTQVAPSTSAPPTQIPTIETTPSSALPTITSQPTRISGIALVDQSAGFDPNTVSVYQNLVSFTPMGQEFTPTLPALDAAELLVNAYMCNTGPSLQVNIREATIRGPIVGRSSPFVPVKNNFHGIARFDFPTLVRVTPGSLYVIEAVDVSGKAFPCVESMVGVVNLNLYPGGRQILSGEPQTSEGLFFREGLARANPLTTDYCMEDLWQHLSRADGSAFRNQGDCIQFVNTGK
jgi:hypothetical protein